MNREEIQKYIPHRPPMLLLDEVEIGEDGVVHSRYRIPEDAFFCQGHFPGNPMVPGVILCEIIAQSCLFLSLEDLAGHLGVYRGINDMKFKQIVRPGDLCETTCRIQRKMASVYICEASMTVSGRPCCSGTITFALMPA